MNSFILDWYDKNERLVEVAWLQHCIDYGIANSVDNFDILKEEFVIKTYNDVLNGKRLTDQLIAHRPQVNDNPVKKATFISANQFKNKIEEIKKLRSFVKCNRFEDKKEMEVLQAKTKSIILKKG